MGIKTEDMYKNLPPKVITEGGRLAWDDKVVKAA